MKSVFVLLVVLCLAIPAFAQDTGWIGASITDQADVGVRVRSVEPNSPAERAGLRANDVIVDFGKEEVIGALQLTRLVSETPVGRTVDITIRRDGREETMKITTERAPFGFAGIRIQRPDLYAFGDQIARNIPQIGVLTTVSMSQAGIRVDSLTPQLREFFGVQGNEGVLVASVNADSAAARAGVKAGDVITAVDAVRVSSPSEFAREVRTRTTAFTLKVVRDKQEREIRVEAR